MAARHRRTDRLAADNAPTTLADNVADVAETDEELDALVGRMRLLFKLECLDRHMAPTKHPNSLEAQADELGAPASDDKTNH